MRNTEQNSGIYVHILSNEIPDLAKLDKQNQDAKYREQLKQRRIERILTIISMLAAIVSAIGTIIAILHTSQQNTILILLQTQ